VPQQRANQGLIKKTKINDKYILYNWTSKSRIKYKK
jgi:hypothetical protein